MVRTACPRCRLVQPTPEPVDQQLAHTLFAEPDSDPAAQELRTVAISQQTRDTGDLFGNDW